MRAVFLRPAVLESVLVAVVVKIPADSLGLAGSDSSELVGLGGRAETVESVRLWARASPKAVGEEVYWWCCEGGGIGIAESGEWHAARYGEVDYQAQPWLQSGAVIRWTRGISVKHKGTAPGSKTVPYNNACNVSNDRRWQGRQRAADGIQSRCGLEICEAMGPRPIAGGL